MALVERLELLITGNGDQAVRELKRIGDAADKDLAKTTSGLDKFAGKMQIGGAAAVGFAAVALPALGKLGSAAGDLGETISKSNVIFGTSAATVEKFGSSAATSIGLSKRAAIDAAATFGTLFTNIGKSSAEAAEMSITMTRLAGDLASFSNASPEDAVLALGAALRGESEPIRRFGVLLDDATLKQRAMTLGIYNGAGSLTTAQRAQAAYGEILAQTTKQQGDFARTSDSLANQQRILAANFENLKTSLGEGIAPAMGDVVGGANSLVTKLNELDPSVLKAAGSIAVFGTGAIGAVGGVSVLAGSLVKMRGNLTNAEGGLNNFGKAAGILGATGAVLALTKAGYELGNALDADTKFAEKAAKGLTTYEDALERVGSVQEKSTERFEDFANSISEADKNSTANFLKNIRPLKDQLEQLDKILKTGNIPAAQDYARAMKAAGFSTEEAEAKIGKSTDAYVANKVAAKETARVLDDAAFKAEKAGDANGAAVIPTLSLRDAEKELAKVTKDAAKAHAELNKELTDYEGFLKRTTEATFGLRDADIEWNAALLDFRDTVEENGKVFNTWTKEGIANNQALSKVRDTVSDMIEKVSLNATSVKDLNDKTKPYVATLLESAKAAGLNNKELATLSKYLADLIQHQEINIRINLIPNMDRAKLNAIGSVNPEDVVGILDSATTRDAGGPGEAGKSYRIGTQEYFVPNTGGEFVPLHGAPPLQPYGAPSGSPMWTGQETVQPINITLIQEVDGRVVTKQIVKTANARGGVPLRIRAAS